MKKLLFLLICAASFALAFQACQKPDTPAQPSTPETVHVTGVTVSASSVALSEGGSQTVTVTVSPANAADKSVTFSSDNTSVATVDANGKITAVGPGTATITITTKDGNKTAKVTVTVTANAVPVTGISLDQTAISLVEGESLKLNATVTPDNATDKTVTWTSSDQAVATVDGSGQVTAVAEGTAVITAQAGDKTATCDVTVNAKEIPLENIVVEPATLELKEGATFDLNVVFLPEGASTKPVSWRSTNSQVASVSKGTVTALKEGKTRIVASVDGTEIEAFCEVTVLPDDALKGIAFGADKYEITLGTSQTLEIVFTPSYAMNKNVTFTSSDSAVASVAADGTVTGVSEGEATITAKSEEGGFTATCTVVVTSAAKAGVYWEQEGWLMLNGENQDIRTRFVAGTDPDGNIYYSHPTGSAYQLALSKNGVDILIYRDSDYYDASKAAAGGGYYFIANPTQYRKNLYVARISDSGDIKSFTLHEGTESYETYVNDIAADADGNVYLAGYIKEYGLYVATLWTVTAGGQVSVQKFDSGTKDTDCPAVAVSGNDVWALVFEGANNSTGKNILAVYKNGQRQYQVSEDLNRNGLGCDLAVVGNDVFVALCEHVPGTSDSRLIVKKNDQQLYMLSQQEWIFLQGLYVTSNGDTYVSGYADTDGQSLNYIWKNDAIIFTPDGIIFNLFVKE